MKYQSAVIGLGRIGCGFDDILKIKNVQTHVGAHLKTKNTNLLAICDKDKSKLKKYGAKYKVKNSYQNYKEMLSKHHFDFISIATLADTHLEIIEEISKYKVKGIFLEKPISNSLKNSNRIVEICKKNNIKLQIDHQRRFDSLYMNLKKIIKKNGEIQRVNIIYGAGISNTGTHVIDLLRFFFGNIIQVEGKFSHNSSNNSKDPNIDGIILFQKSVIVNLTTLNNNNYGLLEMDIFGKNSRIKIDLAKSTFEYFSILKDSSIVYRNLKKNNILLTKSKSPITEGLRDLIKARKNNTIPLCSGIEGYHAIEGVLALLVSAKNNGKKIKMPLKSNLRVHSK